jgi:hypothetical protein
LLENSADGKKSHPVNCNNKKIVMIFFKVNLRDCLIPSLRALLLY